MAKDVETKEKFIQLRAQGRSFDKISQDLNVGKTCLVNWSKELAVEVSNLREIELEALREQYFLSKRARIEAFGRLLQKVREEIEGRDLKEVDTAKLIDLFLKVHSSIGAELQEVNLQMEKKVFDYDLNMPKREEWAA